MLTKEEAKELSDDHKRTIKARDYDLPGYGLDEYDPEDGEELFIEKVTKNNLKIHEKYLK